jgi:putative flippase GtrA
VINLIQKIEDGFMVTLEKISPTLFRLATRYQIYFKYIISGGTAAATDLALLAFFKEIFGFNYLVAAVLAFIIAFGVSFFLQKFWTFGDTKMEGVHRQAGLYLAIAVANLFVNTLLMYIFVDFVHIWYFLSQVIASGLIALFSFFIYRRFVFN